MPFKVIIIFLFSFCLYAKDTCNVKLHTISNLEKSYRLVKKCKFTPYRLYKQAEKSYLGEQFYKALFMLKKADVSYLKVSLKHKLLLLKGNIYNRLVSQLRLFK